MTWQAPPLSSDWWYQVCALEETWHSCTERWSYLSSDHKKSLPLVTVLWGWMTLCALVCSFWGYIRYLNLGENWALVSYSGRTFGAQLKPRPGLHSLVALQAHCWEKSHQAWCHAKRGPCCCSQVTFCTRALSLAVTADVPSKSLRKT